MVWRKADSWTAFTDGYRTWINGPFGLQQRLNTQRFPWESDAGVAGLCYALLAPSGSAQSAHLGVARPHGGLLPRPLPGAGTGQAEVVERQTRMA
jgi:hypothetical protein